VAVAVAAAQTDTFLIGHLSVTSFANLAQCVSVFVGVVKPLGGPLETSQLYELRHFSRLFYNESDYNTHVIPLMLFNYIVLIQRVPS
jgi:hypothetical protein